MPRRKPIDSALSLPNLLAAVRDQLRPPVGVVLGSPRPVAELLASLPPLEGEPVCYQLDLYQADRLRQELAERGVRARVTTAPDLWDLPDAFATLLYPVAEGGERMLKLDMLEQAFHVLRPHGQLVVLSPYEKDQFFPGALKKIYGKVHAPAAGGGALLWCHRQGERPRRRHEITYQISGGAGPSLRFLSRPGVFSYGRFDEGARALMEVAEVAPGARVVDIGCGCGTNGVIAGLRGGPDSRVTFIDSNVRALALAEHNARANGLAAFDPVASADVTGEPGAFDVAFANPPYFAQLHVAEKFVTGALRLLRPGGLLFLVTKQPGEVGQLVADAFGEAEAEPRRGYVVLIAVAPGRRGR
jgi:16S rRNA (guanine1207-N2)-methyltransferase